VDFADVMCLAEGITAPTASTERDGTTPGSEGKAPKRGLAALIGGLWGGVLKPKQGSPDAVASTQPAEVVGFVPPKREIGKHAVLRSLFHR
jgi:hypothetical protein